MEKKVDTGTEERIKNCDLFELEAWKYQLEEDIDYYGDAEDKKTYELVVKELANRQKSNAQKKALEQEVAGIYKVVDDLLANGYKPGEIKLLLEMYKNTKRESLEETKRTHK